VVAPPVAWAGCCTTNDALHTPDLTSTVAFLHLPCAAVAVPRGPQLRSRPPTYGASTKRHVAAALLHIDGLQYVSSPCAHEPCLSQVHRTVHSGRCVRGDGASPGFRPFCPQFAVFRRALPGSQLLARPAALATGICPFLMFLDGIPAGSNTPGTAGAGGRRARRRRRGRARSRLDCWPARKPSTCWHCAKGSFAWLHPHKSQHGESCSRASTRTAVARSRSRSASVTLGVLSGRNRDSLGRGLLRRVQKTGSCCCMSVAGAQRVGRSGLCVRPQDVRAVLSQRSACAANCTTTCRCLGSTRAYCTSVRIDLKLWSGGIGDLYTLALARSCRDFLWLLV
jgi:hypothetical protein